MTLAGEICGETQRGQPGGILDFSIELPGVILRVWVRKELLTHHLGFSRVDFSS